MIIADVRERRGLGVGAEMMWAKMNRIPVISFSPKNSHYRKKEVNLLGAKIGFTPLWNRSAISL